MPVLPYGPGKSTSAGGVPGGLTTQIQYNNAGVFAGDSTFVLNTTTKRISVSSLSINDGASSFISTRTGVNSDGFNFWMGNGGNNSIGDPVNTYYGSYNMSIGVNALIAATTAYHNIGIGSGALQAMTGGTGNVAVGFTALGSLNAGTFGGNSVAIGKQAGYSTVTGVNNIFIGYQAGYSETGSGKLYISNSNTATPLIGGDFTTGILTNVGVAIPTISSTSTLTNKRVTKRIQTLTSAATITPAGDTNDLVVATAQAAAFTLVNPTGTPTDGQAIVVRIKATAAFAITYGTLYQSSGVYLLPASTVSAKTITLRFIYDLTAVKWVLLALDGTGY